MKTLLITGSTLLAGLMALPVSAATLTTDRGAFNALGSGSGYFTDFDNQGSTAPLPFGFGPVSFSGQFGTAFYWASDWHENEAGVNGNVDGTAWVQMRLNTFNGPVTIGAASPSDGFQMLGFDLRPYVDAVGNSDAGETILFATNTGESGSFTLPAGNTAAFLGLVFDAPVQSVSFSIGPDHGNGYTWFGIDNLQTFTSAVPEPGSLAMVLGGLGALSCVARRRKQP